MYVLHALESVLLVHAWMPEKKNEGFGSPGTGVVDVVSHHVGSGNRTWVVYKNSN